MNEILQGSVFDRINDVPDGWADVILTDPPYNSGGTARDKDPGSAGRPASF